MKHLLCICALLLQYICAKSEIVLSRQVLTSKAPLKLNAIVFIKFYTKKRGTKRKHEVVILILCCMKYIIFILG